MRMCVFYGVAHRGASGGLKENEGEAKESEYPFARASNLVRVPGRAERWERGRRPGGRVWDRAVR